MAVLDTNSSLNRSRLSPETTNITLESNTKNNEKYIQRMSRPAVQVRNACKAYDKGSPILSDFNMTVERGTIYGLLGASGCGKTTMLACIVGLRKLDSGEINVFGSKPGTKESGIPGKTIGYMPQEIALYELFTIKEILNYFGLFYNMTRDEINSRMEFLVKFLDLPDCSQIIGSLSGGQQRRTSLAVAMMHEPELLILDEPTVGVDPLIRENIWEYLCEMVKRRNTTVIITTHYIEEARQSHTVGLMRSGRLLVEKSPQILLEEYNTNLLEDIVLTLCKKDSNLLSGVNQYSDEIKNTLSETSFYTRRNPKTDSLGQNSGVVGLKYKSRSPDYDTLFRPKQPRLDQRRQSVIQKVNDTFSTHVNKIISLVIRNFTLVYRNPLFLIIFLTLPTMQIAIAYTILGGKPYDVKVGLVNNEFKAGDHLQSCANRIDSCFAANISCSFVNKFEGQIDWKKFPSEAEALENVQQGKSWGYLSIPANFTQHMKDRSIWRNFVTNQTINGTTITARLDMTNSVQRGLLVDSILSNYQTFVKQMVTDCGGDPRTVELPLKFNAVYGSLNWGVVLFTMPAQILDIIYLIPMANGVTYVLDKKAGTLERTLVAGVNFIHIFTSSIISEVSLMTIELALCFTASVLFFGFSSQGSWILSILLSFLTGICGLSLGFLVGNICSHEVDVIVLILGTYMPILLLNGGIWPLTGVHEWVKVFCDILPLTLPIESFRSIVSRGWGFTHPGVWPGFAVLAIWIMIFCGLNFAIYRLRK